MVFESKEPKVVLGKHAPCSCRQNCGILGGKRTTENYFAWEATNYLNTQQRAPLVYVLIVIIGKP